MAASPLPRGWGGGRAGSGRPESRGGSGGSRRLGEARAAFHPGMGTWCPDRRPCVGPVSQYKGDRAARGEGARGRAGGFSPALREDGFLTRCRLYSQQINNFLSRQQCWPLCVCVRVHVCRCLPLPSQPCFPPAPPRRARRVHTARSGLPPSLSSAGLLPAVRELSDSVQL